VVEYGPAETIFSQGHAGDSVMYIRKGGVKLSVHSKAGREAVVAMLGQGDFFGEDCLAGQLRRKGSATAIAPSAIQVIGKVRMVRLLREQHALSDRFIFHMLTRYIRIEEDLVDQLFNSTETRLAQALLRLAGYGTHDQPQRVLRSISQQRLAEMVGTTRLRVNVLLKKFERLGLIDRGRRNLTIDDSLLGVVLRD
jgi:CRP-like cAMP-binding protein